MIGIIYVLLIIGLVYISTRLERDLEKDYYTSYANSHGLGVGKFFFIALLFPGDYFKKEAIQIWKNTASCASVSPIENAQNRAPLHNN